MAAVIYLDTHVAAWLYAGRVDLLPLRAKEAIEGSTSLLISPMVGLELQYLFETGRTSHTARVVLDTLKQAIGLNSCDLAFQRVAEMALDQRWTRDPFDRLIVSQALARGAPLVTKDALIHAHFPQAIWGP